MLTSVYDLTFCMQIAHCEEQFLKHDRKDCFR